MAPSMFTSLPLCIFVVIWTFATAIRVGDDPDTNSSSTNSLLEFDPVGPPPPPLPDSRLMGGFDPPPFKYGFMGVLIRGRSYFCSATLIHDRFALTAAHCVDSMFRDYKVLLGINKVDDEAKTAQVIPVAEVFQRKWYRMDPLKEDLAILKLEKLATINKYVFPISIAPYGPHEGMAVTILGFGETTRGFFRFSSLQAGYTKVFSFQVCQKIFPFIMKDMFCVKGSARTCIGDAGGPAIHQGKLVGIASFGPIGCKRHYPRGFAHIHQFQGWIFNIVSTHDKSGSNYPSSDVYVLLALLLVLLVRRRW
ncbi:trypsin-2 [Penaeus vannamei]|uniref:trypsin-2 n=1 Tax=Penaeus vannamei TaxID=6689 RepID=UPI00387FA7B1